MFSRPNWDPLLLSPAGACEPSPHPLVPGGGAHSLLRERGGSQFQRGDIHCGTLGILYMHFVWGVNLKPEYPFLNLAG
jgi:hypothetical protein